MPMQNRTIRLSPPFLLLLHLSFSFGSLIVKLSKISPCVGKIGGAKFAARNALQWLHTYQCAIVLLVSLPRSLTDSLINTNVDHKGFCPARIAADSINESADMLEALSVRLSRQSRPSTNLIYHCILWEMLSIEVFIPGLELETETIREL